MAYSIDGGRDGSRMPKLIAECEVDRFGLIEPADIAPLMKKRIQGRLQLPSDETTVLMLKGIIRRGT